MIVNFSKLKMAERFVLHKDVLVAAREGTSLDLHIKCGDTEALHFQNCGRVHVVPHERVVLINDAVMP